MQSLFRQTSLILSKPPLVQTTPKHHLVKSKICSNIVSKDKTPSTLICQGVVNKNYAAISHNHNSSDMKLNNEDNKKDNDDQYLVEGLRREFMPKHIAVILDGSRRWFKAKGKTINYEPFFQANTLFADLCLKWGIGTATTYIYSLKNLERGHEANELLFRQLQMYLEENLESFKRKGIRVWMIGEKLLLPEYLHDTIKKIEKETKNNSKLEWMLAICYGGTRDIVQATRSISIKVKEGMLDPEEVDEDLMEQELWTNPSRAPYPDLLIRTGGRMRISNYLIWQLGQTELYFSNTYAPDYKEIDFVDALRSYQERERTFGE